MEKRLGSIPSGFESRGWRLFIQKNVKSKPQEMTVSQLVLSSKYGTLKYGFLNGKYDTWGFFETLGGGVLLIGYSIIEGELYVGLVNQARPMLGKGVFVDNCPRGFIRPGEFPDEAAKREGIQETGIISLNPVKLPGQPLNSNSTFFGGEGLKYYAFSVEEKLLKKRGSRYVLKQSSEPSVREGISEFFFVHHREAIMVQDVHTVASVARLRAFLGQ